MAKSEKNVKSLEDIAADVEAMVEKDGPGSHRGLVFLIEGLKKQYDAKA